MQLPPNLDPAKEPLRQRLNSLSPAQRALLRRRVTDSLERGHQLVARALLDCGIERLSGICGTPADSIFSSAHSLGLRILGFRRQDSAVLASASDNYSSRRLVHAVCVSAGPAITNTCTGVLFAKDNQLPVLLLGTRRSLIDEGSGYFQEFDAVPMMRPLTKWAATITSTALIIPMIRQAIEVAISDNPGPVFLDIPEDILVDFALPTNVQPPARPYLPVPDNDIAEALTLIRQAKSPLLCLGEGTHWSVVPSNLRRFIENEGLPFVTTSMARGLVADTHPLCVNSARRVISSQADLFVMVGAWFDWRFRMGSELGDKTSVIHAHGVESQLGKNVNSIQTLHCDPGVFLNQISTLSTNSLSMGHSSDWIRHVHSLCNTHQSEKQPTAHYRDNELSATDLFRELQQALPPDAIITVDGNLSLSAAQSALSINTPRSWFDPGQNGLIGGSLPLAIGFQLANPGRSVFAIISDTSFGMSGMEWETCARHNIPVIGIVSNNDGNTGTHRDKNLFPDSKERISSYTPRIHYEEIAKTLGIQAESITQASKLQKMIANAIQSNQACCINAFISPDFLPESGPSCPNQSE